MSPKISPKVSTVLFTLACTLFLANATNVGVAVAEIQQTFHVSPDGSDNNPGTETKSFASIEKARDTVRELNRNMSGDIVVILHGGTFRIDRTIAWGPHDSGFKGHRVIYKARKGESPVISGGQRITNWQADIDGRWKAPTKIDNFRQLYVNGRRMVRARGAAPANIELHGENGYKASNARMATWRNPGDIEFCYQDAWCHTRCKVASIKQEGAGSFVSMLQPQFTHARTKEGRQLNLPRYIENALELLDEPGEWYLDRATGTLYYRPLVGEDLAQVEVIAPAVEKLVDIRGTLEEPVHDLYFEAVTFADAGWLLPSCVGLVDVQANFVVNAKAPLPRDGTLAAVHNEYLKSPANVVCHAAKNVRFHRCTFTRLGGAGIDLEYGSQENVISGCHFYNISSTAIQVGDVLRDDHHPTDERMIVKNNSVKNNYVHDIGVEYMDAVGVFVGYTEATTIAHNEITRLPYSAISMGWGWGEEDVGGVPKYYQPFKYDTPTPSRNNLVEHNHIHYVMQKLQDGGAVYTLGNMPGTVIRGNYIHDSQGGPGGIYLDEGSGFIEVTKNRVFRVDAPMFHNNRVQKRNETCHEHDNFFGDSPSGPATDVSEEVKTVIESAGLMPEYFDLLKHQ